eukprot:CAMPEP_0197857068 /NCGR_PEP_ID=MMETSP1438-20131217/29792_1 /TAXON_ID=1461541 /ORGANISM="Pterosperma sp., Strain CCMP1384" /LENGTH=250 /DNA_ID=CAMNT_0043472761 /DNA_START=119 /DNA_END=871 /DNA_ORIENTATION=+
MTSSLKSSCKLGATTAPRNSRFVVHAAATSPKKKTIGGRKTGAGKKAEEFCFGLPGNTAPMGDFDPLKFSVGKDENTIKRYREAELTHGRVAMLASVGFIVNENFNPLFDGAIKGPAITQFQQVPTPFWLGLLAVIATAELTRANTGWVSPGAGKGASWIEGPFFELKDNYTPGDIGWDPLNIKPTTKEEFDIMQTKELNHGRLAMFAILGDILQEEITGMELFNLQDDGILNDANCPPGIVCNILEASG